MTAASERVQDAGRLPSDPPWTKDTVAYLNAHYDGLADALSGDGRPRRVRAPPLACSPGSKRRAREG